MQVFDAEKIQKELKAGNEIEIYLKNARDGENPYAKMDAEMTDKQNEQEEPERIKNRQSENLYVKMMQLQKDLRSPDPRIRDEAARKLPEAQEQYSAKKKKRRSYYSESKGRKTQSHPQKEVC